MAKTLKHTVDESFKIKSSHAYHLVGIGGIGMQAIAYFLLEKGCKVSGSDLNESPAISKLRHMGASISIGHHESNISKTNALIVSSAIKESNPEYQAALKKKIPIVKRACALESIFSCFPNRISVSGTHGKTTTTAMLMHLFEKANLSPSYFVGSTLIGTDNNAFLSKHSKYFITEADESDGSFVLLSTTIGIITNIEEEHMDFYLSFENLMAHFKRYLQDIFDKGGYLALNADDKNVMSLVSDKDKDKVVTFGFSEDADVRATEVSSLTDGSQFKLWIHGTRVGAIHMNTFGKHNVYNALASFAIGHKEGLSPSLFLSCFEDFPGTRRRCETIFKSQTIHIYDDYAHHPTEIETSLNGLKDLCKGNLICICQPHRYSRVQRLIKEYPTALSKADKIILTDIYSAHEDPIDEIDSSRIVNDLVKLKKDAVYCKTPQEIVSHVLAHIKPQDIVVTMGAGDIRNAAFLLAEALKKR